MTRRRRCSTTSSRSPPTRRTPAYVYAVWDRLVFPSERAGERRRLVPLERVQRPDLVRALDHGRRRSRGSRRARSTTRPERPDDRQPDRRPAERDARGHLHRVQQREHEQAPRRPRPRAALDGQGRDLVGAVSSSTGSGRSRSPIPRRALPSARATSSRTSPSTGRTGALYAVWQDARFNGGQTRQHRVLAVARRRAHLVDADQGQPDADRDPDRQPAGVHAVRRRLGDDGTVAVTYYDFRNNTADPTPLPTDYFVAHCHPTTATACTTRQLGQRGRGSPTQPFDMRRRALCGRLLHRRLRGPRGDRRLPGVLLATARQRPGEHLLPAHRAVAPGWRGASAPRHRSRSRRRRSSLRSG